MHSAARVYYDLKPLLPVGLRLGLRRWHARRRRPGHRHQWPILPGSEQPPAGWPGWPDGKKFAVVLTHDVEGAGGYARIRELVRLEQELGFRSSFNLVPEGPYRVEPEMRRWLAEQGCEVGVHDLYHDGKLYRSREEFSRRARKINRYVKEWGAAGFRSAYMHHRLDWLGELEVAYDASTFDTDPFEPQPDGVGTIFPFWVPRQSSQETGDRRQETGDRSQESEDGRWETGDAKQKRGNDTRNAHSALPNPVATEPSAKSDPHSPIRNPQSALPAGSQSAIHNPQSALESGFIELPYTLPQDSTLFLFLGEQNIDVWKQKVDWIAKHGGMVLVNVHPDYLDFDGRATDQVYPVSRYRELLEYVRDHYSGQYWHALPREVAAIVRKPPYKMKHEVLAQPDQAVCSAPMGGRPIWIDLENTPHIPFFKPIIRELEQRGYRVVLSARDAYQTCEMATQYGFKYERIGHHYGKNMVMKFWGLLARSFQLLSFARRERPCLSLNHGSRTQTLISNLLGIPTVTIMDYEHTGHVPLVSARWNIMPEVVVKQGRPKNSDNLLAYSGIKEDVYVPDFVPDPAIYEALGLNQDKLIVTVRPPATEAHYHNPEAEVLFERFVERAFRTPDVQAVLLPRNQRQKAEIHARWPHWFGPDRKVLIPEGVVNGLNLLWASDLVVSGGGTMNREAAAMGIPVFSIFRGTIGAVDRQLQAEGRMTLIETPAEIESKIPLQRRVRSTSERFAARPALADIVNHVDTILKAAA